MIVLSNPRCSKCRQLLSYLHEQAREFQVREYLNEPLSLSELRGLAQKLGQPVRLWTREPVPDDPEGALECIVARPEILQRPIVIDGERATVARSLPEFADWLKARTDL